MSEIKVSNFRSNYYQKLGSTCGVEEKKSLGILLNNNVVDIKKIEQFCLRYHVPADFRCQLWKILLKVSPNYQKIVRYVHEQRQEHYTDLRRSIMMLRIRLTDSSLDEPDLHTFTAMYLAEHCFILDWDKAFELDNAKLFNGICKMIMRLEFPDCDTYWCARNFTNLVRTTVHPFIDQLVECTLLCLSKEDIDSKLYQHLEKHHALEAIPFKHWFYTCFSTVLPDTYFERVWDKVMAGSSMVLVFVAVATILMYKRPLLVCESAQEMVDRVSKVETDTADEIVRRGIELWQRYGNKLRPSSARMSPAFTDRPSSAGERPSSTSSGVSGR